MHVKRNDERFEWAVDGAGHRWENCGELPELENFRSDGFEPLTYYGMVLCFEYCTERGLREIHNIYFINIFHL